MNGDVGATAGLIALGLVALVLAIVFVAGMVVGRLTA